METIFLVAGIVPVLLAAIAMYAAKMRRDELANPLR
jgi:DHA3 family tetracycline resistance protein-like MFS transporter